MVAAMSNAPMHRSKPTASFNYAPSQRSQQHRNITQPRRLTPATRTGGNKELIGLDIQAPLEYLLRRALTPSRIREVDKIAMVRAKVESGREGDIRIP